MSTPVESRDVATSAAWFERARRVIPGGVNSPVRAFQAVGGTPRFFTSGRGAIITDVDGNTIIDLIGGDHMVLGEVTGIHLRDDCLVGGRFDVTRYHPAARLGYHDYAFVTEVTALQRPK